VKHLYVLAAVFFAQRASGMHLEFDNPELGIKFPELPIQVNGSIAGNVGPVILTIDQKSVYTPIVAATLTGIGAFKIANSCLRKRKRKQRKHALSQATSTANLARRLVKSESEMSLDTMESGLQHLDEPKKPCCDLTSCWSPMLREITVGLLFVAAGYWCIADKLQLLEK